MKPSLSKRTVNGLTLIEVLMMAGVLMLLGALFLGTLNRPYAPHKRESCVNNLKQMGLAFRLWEGDDQQQTTPMQVSTNAGGTKEFVGSAETFRHFQVMSNELSTPKVLICPEDRRRTRATNFLSDFHNGKLSYFVGVDARVDEDPSALLSGDRNITNGTPITDGMLELTTNRLSGWTGEMHVKQGNILLADGSVSQLTTPQFRDQLTNCLTATNRLALP